MGPQASGKSLTAQTLYFLRKLEHLLMPGEPGYPAALVQTQPEPSFRKLVWDWSLWLGVNPLSLSHRDTVVRWKPPGQAVEQEILLNGSPDAELHPRGHGALNEALRERIEKIRMPSGTPALIREEQVYVPSGRLLQSFVAPGQAQWLLNTSDLKWPAFVNLFYLKLSEALKRLSERARQSQRPSVPDHIGRLMEATLMGRLSFPGPDSVQLGVEDLLASSEGYSRGYGFDPLKLASGQMELWPLWTIILHGLLGSSPNALRIFCEEPEAHLHPTAQRKLVDAIALLTKENQRFVLTTHSPYVIYALNNCLLAHQLLASGQPIPASATGVVPLRPDQVSAYRFVRGGCAESLLDQETGLINTEELDDPAAEMNAIFSDMQDALGRFDEP